MNARELVNDFQWAVDDYLAMCHEEDTSPEIAYKGSLNIRLGSDLHKHAAVYIVYVTKHSCNRLPLHSIHNYVILIV